MAAEESLGIAFLQHNNNSMNTANAQTYILPKTELSSTNGSSRVHLAQWKDNFSPQSTKPPHFQLKARSGQGEMTKQGLRLRLINFRPHLLCFEQKRDSRDDLEGTGERVQV